jgi:hypothetical protein
VLLRPNAFQVNPSGLRKRNGRFDTSKNIPGPTVETGGNVRGTDSSSAVTMEPGAELRASIGDEAFRIQVLLFLPGHEKHGVLFECPAVDRT